MDVKEAVARAKVWFASMMADERISHVGLEEVAFDEASGSWIVTLGFFREWSHHSLTLLGGREADRVYREVTVNDATGEVKSMKRPEAA